MGLIDRSPDEHCGFVVSITVPEHDKRLTIWEIFSDLDVTVRVTSSPSEKAGHLDFTFWCFGKASDLNLVQIRLAEWKKAYDIPDAVLS